MHVVGGKPQPFPQLGCGGKEGGGGKNGGTGGEDGGGNGAGISVGTKVDGRSTFAIVTLKIIDQLSGVAAYIVCKPFSAAPNLSKTILADTCRLADNTVS